MHGSTGVSPPSISIFQFRIAHIRLNGYIIQMRFIQQSEKEVTRFFQHLADAASELISVEHFTSGCVVVIRNLTIL